MEDTVMDDRVAVTLGEEFDEFASVADRLRDREPLDPKRGLLVELCRTAENMATEYARRGETDRSEFHDWVLEARTWNLLRLLCLLRTRQAEEHQPQSQPSHAFSSNVLLTENLHIVNKELAEITLLLNWSRDANLGLPNIETRADHWLHTRQHIKSRVRASFGTPAEDTFVNQLDPDAPARQGKELKEEDAEYEKTLFQALFACIRAGELEVAVELAEDTKNHWFAAAVQGCTEYHDPKVDGITPDDAANGTKRKALWRRACHAAAGNEKLDKWERAVWGALCGDLTSVLDVCETWEDQLWAYLNAVSESAVEANLRNLGRSQLTGGLEIEDLSHMGVQHVLEKLAQSDQIEIREAAHNPFRRMQAALITGQVDLILQEFNREMEAARVRKVSAEEDAEVSLPTILRMLVHVIITLRRIGVQTDEIWANNTIARYVELLAAHDKGDILPLYVAELPEPMQIESYAAYLCKVEMEIERENQSELARYYHVGFDGPLKRMVQLVFEQSAAVDPEYSVFPREATIGPVKGWRDPVKHVDERQIHALEWMAKRENLKGELLRQGNVLFRRFLQAGRLTAARELHERISEQNIELSGHDDTYDRDGLEYASYGVICNAYETYDQWKTLMAKKPYQSLGRTDPVGFTQWKAEIETLTQALANYVLYMLQDNWLHPEMSLALQSTEDRKRYNELVRLRNFYIPEVVFMLQDVYYQTREFLPESLPAMLDLSCLIASEEQQLYSTFVLSGRMGEYLQQLVTQGFLVENTAGAGIITLK
ncbi:hypothetical protein G7K_0863-t1 [Saitoella complicata NRRL Y-17804]|uniref:Nuclear pore complex protein n=2 Tax=Saitoella complicata (strain BCRC 22490 / CBS 7301 / JCM 7358 / NBRC 10748 / NRRL Y-17804) TaxID=698492 RepID=A0A0E9N9S1_SAICN|nr:hypothetical protein G7K_0863-t1 [Saitoella complicata NRRL Y-17804]